MNTVIAIDGPSASGKSTIAKALAAKLGFVYIDSGAMYRAVGLYATQNNIDLDDEAALAAMMDKVRLDIKYLDGAQLIFLNHRDVTDDVRTAQAGLGASAVARFAAVRDKIVSVSREMAHGQDVIMDGRDIGTVVLPDANVKIYLTASAQERAKRRVSELEKLGQNADFDDILEQITKRDEQDTSRAIAPLKQAEDAHLLDTTGMDIEQVSAAISGIIDKRGDA
ncbi:MAG: (d)CMP kinase [Defluviitaleaceae bacterium]|nr:(d)CMP kinase [Defluviitaleaceae bacterium]